MNRRFLVVLVLGILLSSVPLSAQIRAEKPNDFSIELGGRCILYSLNYQRMISPAFGLEVGASYFPAGLPFLEIEWVFLLSGGGRYYFINKNASPYLAGGIVWLSGGTNAGPISTAASGVYFYASPGFELRGAGGFVFRAGVNFLFEEGFKVMPGIHLGFAF